MRLLALVEDPREMAIGLRRTERRWLKEAGPRLRLAALSSLDPASSVRAEQAYRLLLGE